MSSPSLSESAAMRELAVEAAMSVREDLLAAFRSPMRKDFKRDLHDIVTVHDQAAEKTISDILRRGLPGSVIVGEEGGKQGCGIVEWHVDPIDGTSNFSRGLPSWCVSIGAVFDGRPCAGVILHPVSGDVFSADLNGAWLNDRTMTSAAASEQIDATIVSSFPNAKDTGLFGADAMTAQNRLIDDFQAVRNLGSGALNLAYVAAGWADATMGFQTNTWDICAGSFILEKAGGAFYGYRSGEPVEPGYLAKDYFAVGAGGDYQALREVIETHSARI